MFWFLVFVFVIFFLVLLFFDMDHVDQVPTVAALYRLPRGPALGSYGGGDAMAMSLGLFSCTLPPSALPANLMYAIFLCA